MKKPGTKENTQAARAGKNDRSISESSPTTSDGSKSSKRVENSLEEPKKFFTSFKYSETFSKIRSLSLKKREYKSFNW